MQVSMQEPFPLKRLRDTIHQPDKASSLGESGVPLAFSIQNRLLQKEAGELGQLPGSMPYSRISGNNIHEYADLQYVILRRPQKDHVAFSRNVRDYVSNPMSKTEQ